MKKPFKVLGAWWILSVILMFGCRLSLVSQGWMAWLATVTPTPTATATVTPTPTVSPTPTWTPTPLPYQGEVHIAHLLPLTGPFPDIGQIAQQVAQLWRDSHQGVLTLGDAQYQIVLHFEDTGLDPDQAREAALRSGQVPILGVIGPYGTVPALQAASWFEVRRIPVLLPWTTYPEITSKKRYVFRVNVDDELLAQALLLWARKMKAQRLGILVEEGSSFSEVFGERLIVQAEQWGFRTLVSTFSDEDPSSRVRALRQLKSQGPDVFLWPVYPDRVRKLLPLIGTLHLTQPVLGLDVWEDPLLHSCLACQTLAFMTPWLGNERVRPDTPEGKTFVDLYQQYIGGYPNQIAFLTWEAYQILTQALQQCAPLQGHLTQDRACIRALLETETFTGLTGPVRFNADGDALRCLWVITWDEQGYWTKEGELCLAQEEAINP